MAKKKKSSFINMTVSLLIITLISAVSLAYVNSVTKASRKKAQTSKRQEAIKIVLPEFTRLDDPVVINIPEDGEDITLFSAYNKNDLVGIAVETYSLKGFGGKITVLAGFLPNGGIYNTAVLSHAETPGLGDKMETSKSNFSKQFEGKNPESFKLKVKKDGGDIDAITAATISSRAFADALQKAYDVLKGQDTQKKTKTILEILPPHQSIETKSMIDANNNELKITQAFNEQKELTGIGVETYSNKGFHGLVSVLVSFLPNGEIYNSAVLKHNETPGYGDMMETTDFTRQFEGKNPESFKLKVKKDGGDVDVFSGATISTNAYAEAVQKAYNLIKKEGLIK